MSIKEKVIALGFFDGVHLGHAALLRRTVEEAKARMRQYFPELKRWKK